MTRVHVPFTDAALGAEVARARRSSPRSADATLPLTLPAGTQSGAVFTMKGHGVPRLDGRGRGSLVVVVQVEVPTALSPRAQGAARGARRGAARRGGERHERGQASRSRQRQ